MWATTFRLVWQLLIVIQIDWSGVLLRLLNTYILFLLSLAP